MGACDERAGLPYESERLSSTGEVRGAGTVAGASGANIASSSARAGLHVACYPSTSVPTHKLFTRPAGGSGAERRDVFFSISTQDLIDAVRNVERSADERSPDAQGVQAHRRRHPVVMFVVHTGSSAPVPSSMECSTSGTSGSAQMACVTTCSAKSCVDRSALLVHRQPEQFAMRPQEFQRADGIGAPPRKWACGVPATATPAI